MNRVLIDRSSQLSVIIPVFDEAPCLPELIERCLKVCTVTGRPFEIILVDDGSTDGSREIIEDGSCRHPERVIGVLLNRNYGQHAAVLAGLAHSRGQIVVTLDADLQNPPEEIPRLIAKIEEGYDVVGTVRQHRRDTVLRRLFSAVINRMV